MVLHVMIVIKISESDDCVTAPGSYSDKKMILYNSNSYGNIIIQLNTRTFSRGGLP